MGMMYGFIYEGTYKYEDFDKVGDTYTLNAMFRISLPKVIHNRYAENTQTEW
jgi:hypothetical protein